MKISSMAAALTTTLALGLCGGFSARAEDETGRSLHGDQPAHVMVTPADLKWIDGAKPGWQTLRYITLPQLRTTSVAVLLLLLIAAYQAFDEFYNVLGTDRGYPPFARPPLIYLYYTALGSGGQDFGQELGHRET